MNQPVSTVRVLGRQVAAGSFAAIGEAVLDLARRGAQSYICVSATHPLSLARSDPDFARVLDGAALILPDGRPVSWIQRLKGFAGAEQVSGPDLAPWLVARAEAEKIPVYFFGGLPDELTALKATLAQKHAGLDVVGWESPPTLPERPDFDPEATARINASGAKLVFVGLGCPRQEWWMARHSPEIGATLIGIGAAFNFMSGRLERAPRWIRALGLEWLRRLLAEPRRLAGRYLVHNSRFLWFGLLDLLAHWTGRREER
ncbi:WecB/TagA/CpsF family glycosyltransferase [Nisaea acidiphila]|uniref:WecB/TagA/CpsF family glycosyltransferase n=1 Tax=Nisaea acidiphila TaxID=1862145 RepID=A0A9J7AZ41_9PROT|nr:WecB/TagA/CpsF family glycosyltransferase [Nisaea acidiphila]UUX52050.1 WecB/TagA/CpsF family glycosyltransferase [Nisaea acidiphila]